MVLRHVTQRMVDVGSPDTYADFIDGHDAAICTLGVSQPSKMTKEEFLRIDRDWVIAFANLCRQRGVRHSNCSARWGRFAFALVLSAHQGQLRDALIALSFERLSLFQPSMILTPSNRFGLSQALTLAFWPTLSHLMLGPARKFRGIRVEALGAAIAHNLAVDGKGVETLQWGDFQRLQRT